MIREGAPDFPDPGIVWRLVEKTSCDDHVSARRRRYACSCVRAKTWCAHPTFPLSVLLFCAGEPFNPEAWQWAQEHICADGGQVLDNYWQTEIASPMIGTFAGMQARPGFAGKPMPGVRLKLVTADGEPSDPGEGGAARDGATAALHDAHDPWRSCTLRVGLE